MTLEPKVVCFMPVEARNASMSASSASFSVMQPFIFGHTQNFKRIFQGAHRLPSKQVMCGLESPVHKFLDFSKLAVDDLEITN